MIANIENRKSYIFIEVVGELNPRESASLAEAKDITLFAFEEAKKNNVSKLLFDASRAFAMMSVMDRYFLMTSLAKTSRAFIEKNNLPDFQIAFLSNEAIFEPHNFDETVARNRGANVCITLDIKEALEWLQVD